MNEKFFLVLLILALIFEGFCFCQGSNSTIEDKVVVAPIIDVHKNETASASFVAMSPILLLSMIGLIAFAHHYANIN